MPVKTGFYTVAGPFERLCGRVRTTFAARTHRRAGLKRGLHLKLGLGLGLGLSLTLAASLGLTSRAHAVDGCKVLLCMAGNWRQIAPCEPTVRQALRDVARGRGWPQCGMSGNSDTASQYVAPVNCPEQYRTEHRDHNDRIGYSCPYSGVVLVAVDGQPWSRTWWSMAGDTVVEWLPAARLALAGRPDVMDSRFTDDHAAWVISERIRRAAELQPQEPGP